MADNNHTAAGGIVRRTVRALGLALIGVMIGVSLATQPLPHRVNFDGLFYLADSLYLRIVNRVVTPAELRLESKLKGGSSLRRGWLTLGDVDAPGSLPDVVSATATLYFGSGEERTIKTTASVIHVVHVFGPPQRLVGIKVPADDEAAFVPTYSAIRLSELVRVVVIVPRPPTGWREI
jgi:hypothetical protein